MDSVNNRRREKVIIAALGEIDCSTNEKLEVLYDGTVIGCIRSGTFKNHIDGQFPNIPSGLPILIREQLKSVGCL